MRLRVALDYIVMIRAGLEPYSVSGTYHRIAAGRGAACTKTAQLGLGFGFVVCLGFGFGLRLVVQGDVWVTVCVRACAITIIRLSLAFGFKMGIGFVTKPDRALWSHIRSAKLRQGHRVRLPHRLP